MERHRHQQPLDATVTKVGYQQDRHQQVTADPTNPPFLDQKTMV